MPVVEKNMEGHSRTVAQSHVEKKGQHYIVSTVSLDHPLVNSMDLMLDIFPTDRPYHDAELSATEAQFETMVFECNPEGEDWNYTEKYCRRYMTEQEAEQGHNEVVGEWS